MADAATYLGQFRDVTRHGLEYWPRLHWLRSERPADAQIRIGSRLWLTGPAVDGVDRISALIDLSTSIDRRTSKPGDTWQDGFFRGRAQVFLSSDRLLVAMHGGSWFSPYIVNDGRVDAEPELAALEGRRLVAELPKGEITEIEVKPPKLLGEKGVIVRGVNSNGRRGELRIVADKIVSGERSQDLTERKQGPCGDLLQRWLGAGS